GPYLAKLVGIKSVVNVTQDIPIAHTTTKQTEDALRAAGVQVAGSLYLPPTTSDMAPWAQKVIESGAEAVNPALSHQQVYALLQALQQLGKPIPVIGNDNELTLPDLKSLGSFVDGANIVMTLPPATSTHIRGVKMFVDDMAAQEKSGDKYAANVGSAAQHTWLGVRIVAKIASQAKGTVDRESFTAALQSAKDVDLFGILPPWTPSSKAPAGAPEGMVNPFVYFTKVKNEQFVLVNEDPYNIATNTFVKINP
ncbi:ABC transporter substrate-binding protein, partial [Dactylosporangium sp. NPDC005572]|uniref:ABC transporter substrate-binding protein n=1 Tax=Dactylosporangium sp. NPDC005572 TaxID=3156889 RepID=UPI0033B66E0A